MRRIWIGFLMIVVWLSLACQAVTSSVEHVLPPTISPFSESILPFTTPSLAPTLTPRLTPSLTPLPTLVAKPRIQAKPVEEFTVRFHPDGDLYIGDHISLEIIAPYSSETNDQEVQVSVDVNENALSSPVKFQPFGLAGRSQATLYWAWDTQGLDPGVHTLFISIEPSHITWQEQVTLLSEQALPAIEKEAHWSTTESDCCNIYYITHTAAERDLDQLVAMVDEQAESASQALDFPLEEPIAVAFIPRILGHGGFASQEVTISYLDRDYVGASEEIVLHHELVHWIDGQLGGENRPSLFVEGLAVYLSGGHFYPEELMPRASALLELGWYIPLQTLLDDFYLSQHEISYLEAGALVEFMVDTWGWRGFSRFYRNFASPAGGENQLDVVNRALSEQFGITFDLLEARFIDYLCAQKISTQQEIEVRFSVDYFESIRRYQQGFDPSAYFLNAWMVDGESLRKKSIVADYLRHPNQIENIVFETMLNAAGSFRQAGDYEQANRILDAFKTVMDGVDQNIPDPYQLNPLAEDYLTIVRSLNGQGYQVQRIIIYGETASVWINQEFTALQEIALLREGDSWVLAKSME